MRGFVVVVGEQPPQLFQKKEHVMTSVDPAIQLAIQESIAKSSDALHKHESLCEQRAKDVAIKLKELEITTKRNEKLLFLMLGVSIIPLLKTLYSFVA